MRDTESNIDIDDSTAERHQLLGITNENSSLDTQPNAVNERHFPKLLFKKNYRILSAFKDLSNKLLDVVLANNTLQIETIVDGLSQEGLSRRYDKLNNKTIVVISCIEQTITSNTLRVLLSSIKKKFGKVDSVDELWYGWEPIHYAAQLTDYEKLEVIVDFIDVNSLTYFSENALHILLENRKFAIQGNLHNDVTIIPCCFVSDMSENALKCTQILLRRQIDYSHNNLWNESAISLALKYNYYKFLKQVLNEYLYIDMEMGRKYKEHLREFLEIMNIPSSTSDVYQEPVVTLFSYLKAGESDSFLSFMNGNIREYVNYSDGGDDFNTSGTMLQLCFRKLFLEYLQCDKYNVDMDDDESDILDTPMLKVFESSEMRR